MSTRVIFDTEPSTITMQQAPAFPRLRFDAGTFILEEALLDGNYVGLHYSAMGRPSSLERMWGKYQRALKVIDRTHLHAFQLEVNGQLLRDHWELESHETRAVGQAEESLLVLRDAEWPVRVTVHTLLDGTAFLERWLEIENTGSESLAISALFPWCGLLFLPEDLVMLPPASTGYALARYRNLCWGKEGEFAWEPLPEGTYREASTQLMKFAPRYFLARNEETAEVAVIDFEYTGGTCVEFTHRAQPAIPRYLHARVGLADPAPQRVLEGGETVQTPRVHLSMQYGDEDRCANALFDHLRRSVLLDRPWKEPHPVGYHVGGYLHPVWISVSPEIIRKEIDLAAMLGAEMFTVDAGWNVPLGKNYPEVFGDWQESPVMDNRLRECFDYARSKGMGGALWVPIEIVGPSSRMLAEHPEWMLRDGERQVQMLDLTQPAVEQYVYQTITGLIDRYDLACFRIDGGPEQFALWDGPRDRYRESLTWRYYETLYRIFERVHAAYPAVALENCWGGGGRIDLGMMRRFHWVQYTDNWHAEEQLRILNGLTFSMPPEQCLAFIGAINSNPVEIDFCIRAGLFGQFCIAGVGPTPDTLNIASFERWRHAVELYKSSIRPWLANCRVYHHTPCQDYARAGDWVGLEYTSADAAAGLFGLFRLGESETDTFTFIARGLDIAKTYDVWFDNAARRVTVPGLQLCTTGLPLRLPGKMMSELLVIKETTAG